MTSWWTNYDNHILNTLVKNLYTWDEVCREEGPFQESFNEAFWYALNSANMILEAAITIRKSIHNFKDIAKEQERQIQDNMGIFFSDIMGEVMKLTDQIKIIDYSPGLIP